MNNFIDAPGFYISRFELILDFMRDSLLSKSPRTAKTGRRLLNILLIEGNGYQYFLYHLSLQGNTLLSHLASLKQPGALENYLVAEHSSFLASQPVTDSIYPSDLEEIEFIEEGWECA